MDERIIDLPTVKMATDLRFLLRERIVRCRDCELTAPYMGGIECCGPLVQTWDFYNDQPLHNPVQPDGFCKWGKRRED